MALIGEIARGRTLAVPALSSAGSRPRARVALLGCTGLAVVGFVVLTLGYLAEPAVVGSATYAAAWWCSCLAVPVLGAAACAAGADPDDEGGYLSALLEGLRAEWRR